MTGPARPRRLDLEVERLVLSDPGMSWGRAERLRVLVEAELGRLLARSPLDLSSQATPLVVAPPLRLSGRPTDHDLATSLARAIVRALEEASSELRF